MLNHRMAAIFIETFLMEFFKKKMNLAKGQSSCDIYIVEVVETIRNEGRGDEFTNYSFTIGANFRADEEKFAKQITDLLMEALRENFDDCSVGIDWTDWTSDPKSQLNGFPEARICVNVY